jgi:hypothetical protein
MKPRPNRTCRWIMFGISLCCIMGCSDVFETNIEKSTINVLAPPDNIHSTLVTQTFWWDNVSGASKYNLQIVSPRFDYIERFVLDTNITTDKFQITLNPGVYEWRICGFNSGYATPYSIRTLFIDSTVDLTLQQVILVSPASNKATNESHIKFKWGKIYM